MFLKLLAGFLLIILLTSTFYLLSYNFFINNIELEIVNNASHNIDFTTAKLDEKLSQLKNILLNFSLEEVFSPLKVGRQSLYTQKQILDNFIEKYKTPNENVLKYVKAIFILPEDSYKNIITTDTTINSDRFFEAFYKSDTYTKEFWQIEMTKEFNFKYYPTSKFLDYRNYKPKNPLTHTLMPLAFKNTFKSNFIIVALIDIGLLYDSFNKFTNDDFCIYNSDKVLLYPSVQNLDFSNTDINNSTVYSKTKNGYLFSRDSVEDNLIYSTFLSNSKLKQQLFKTNTVFRLITATSIFVSILISIYVVKTFNDPVKQIAEIIKLSGNKSNNDVIGLNNIRDDVKQIIEENEEKDSMLEAYFYQSKLKGNYSPFNEIKKHFIINNNNALICFTIHYKESCYNQLFEETGKGIFFLKECISLYLNSYFKDSITFQIENNKVISIFNVPEDILDISTIVNEIANKLKNEEIYVFFTITYSKVCSDTSQLHSTYNKLFEITKYRKLINCTQILSEDSIKSTNNIYYLSSEQTDQFKNLLINCRHKECLEFVDTTLQYNHKKGVNNFNIQLLCTEIINCCIKCLTNLFYKLPSCFDVASIYSQFNSFTAINEYADSCKLFTTQVINYILNNQKGSDYIIDFITDYIEKHFKEEIYLDLLAEKLNLTNNYISSYFKEKTGTNLNFYINNFRIKKAVELLENSSLKIADISCKVGFSSDNTFRRIFKKHIGKTPDEYRKNMILL